MVTKSSSRGVIYIKGCSTRRFVFAVLQGNALEPVPFLSDSIFFFFFLNPYIIHFLKLELFALIDPTILKIKRRHSYIQTLSITCLTITLNFS
jgi:hypothetical protein